MSEYVLADFAAFTFDGPAIIFVRPRRDLSHEEMDRVSRTAAQLGNILAGVRFVVVPHDFDIMAAGEVELARIGWTKLEVADASR